MSQSGLPRDFWADSILTATHIINKLPSSKLYWKSPYELVYNKPPTYDNMKAFGCLCFASNTNPHKSKFDPRAIQCGFIGYIQGQKDYKFSLIVIPNPLDIVNPPIRPQSQKKPLAWLNDFHGHLTSSHHLTSPSSHIDLFAALSTIYEPNHYLQAKGKPEWENSMIEEHTALEKNSTWDIVDLPKGKRAIGCKWMFKVKLKPDGTVDLYKDRLLAKGYNQIEGIDYVDRFSLVAKALLLLVLLGLYIKLTFNAFLHGFLDEDICILPPDGSSIEAGKFLDVEFTIKDLGFAKYFLGLEIIHSTAGLAVSQHKYTRDIMQDTLSEASPLLSFTRPNIAFGAQQLNQYVHQPGQEHMDATLHLVRYLKGNPEQGIFFPCSNLLHLTAFCDADWAGCMDTRRSLTGYCIFLGDALVSWRCKKQTTVARSTAEAEYRSLGTTVCELQWITYLLHDLQIFHPSPIPYKSGFVLPTHVSSKFQLADIFTKQLPVSAFWSFLSKLGLVSSSKSSLRGAVECSRFS
ncbi:UNVERIFIED_CONTAM: Retrovirus-related Pol polyprotein from transposon RE1 [Sesamum latifolium]|uniref:Retrovirus-related Pol polyprotein from transposon RE1 n=1 Tax=Sesamum latifolium TaxID=2727402 RepID=A0AAW2TAK4_9LAMI